MPLRRRLIPAALAVAALVTAVAAAPAPYDESADAKADLARALATAGAARKPVLLIFGANWCGDCRALDASLKAPASAALMGREFVVLKVDVGNFDRNLDLTAQFGHPTKAGIPAAVLLSPDRQVLYATRAGELSNARRMSDAGVLEFFRGVAARARPKT